MNGVLGTYLAIWVLWSKKTVATLAKGRGSLPVRPSDWSYSDVAGEYEQSQWEQGDIAEMVDEKGKRIATFVDALQLNRTTLRAMAMNDSVGENEGPSSNKTEHVRIFLNGGPFLSMDVRTFMPLISKQAKKLCKGKIKILVEEEYIPGHHEPGKVVKGHWVPKQRVPGFVVPPTVLEEKRCFEAQFEKGEWVPAEYVEGRKSGEFEFRDSVYEAGELIEGKKVEKSTETLDNGQLKVTPGYRKKPTWSPGTWIAGYYSEPNVVAPHVLKSNYVGGHYTKGYCKPEVKTKRYRIRDDYYRAKYIPGHFVRPSWSPPTYIPRKYICVVEPQQKEAWPEHNKTANPKLHGCGSRC